MTVDQETNRRIAIRRLTSERDELAAALRFYASSESWKEIETGIGMFASDADRDAGATARAALAKLDKGA